MAVLNVDIIVNDNGSLAIRKVSDEAKKAESSTKDLKKSTDNLSSANNKASSSFTSLSSAIKGLGLAGAIYEMGKMSIEAVKVADSMKLLEARIKLTSSSTDDYSKIQKDMARIANENGIAIQSVGNLYSKLSTSLKPLGIQTSSVMTVTDAFSKSLLISGASTEEASSATLQFAQAMASGRLQGDEFRSMAENSPRFMKAMTESLGKTSAEIRQMAEDGKLTSSIVGGALVDSAAKLREEARNMPQTVGKAFNELKNEATLTVEQFDKLTGVNDTIAKGFQAITSKVVGLREELPKLSQEMTEWEKKNEKAIYTLKAIGSGFLDVTSETLKISADGWGKIADWSMHGIGKAGEALGIVNNDILETDKNLKKTEESIKKINKLQKDADQAKKDRADVQKASEEFKNLPLTKEQIKKQLEDWEHYHKTLGNIEEELAFKRIRYKEKYTTLNDKQIEDIINAERNKATKVGAIDDKWAKKKMELTYEIAIAEQDALVKPYLELEKKYKEDLQEFSKSKEAQELITKSYQAKVQALNKKTAEEFNKQEEEKNKKSAEWQVKLFEANEKINDQFISQREKMYGATSESQIESWYQNQLEWLGKLSLEGKATSEELQALLDKINSLRGLKEQEQTLSFKLEKTFFTTFEDGLTDSIEGVFNGDGLNLKSFFKNIQKQLTRTPSADISGGIVNNFKTLAGFGGAASLVGSALSANDITSLISAGATVADGKVTTSGGTIIDQATGAIKSKGSDILSIANTASSLKTAYGLLTNGISGSILSGFQGASGLLANMGFGGASSGLMSFGAGVANPFAYAGMSGLPTSMTAGSMFGGAALGGLGGYALGSLGDKLFGAQTKAGLFGGIGGALGGLGGALGLFGGPIGMIAGSLLGSVIGGLFGKTKQTGAGIDILGNATAEDASGRYYQSYKKKSWFSSKKWEKYQGFGDAENNAITQAVGAFDTLLSKLGTYDKLVVSGGRFSSLQAFLDGGVVKSFLGAINPKNLDTIYQSWADYAKSIDKTVTQALSATVGNYITYGRGFTEWKLGSGTQEQLKFTADYLQKDFTELANSLNANGVTVDNFLAKYDEAIKANFSQETISAWASLGDTLMKSTDATKKYKEALDKLNGTTAYTLPKDFMLAKVSDSAKPIDIKQLVSTQNVQNGTVISLLIQSVKTLQEILRVSQFGKSIA